MTRDLPPRYEKILDDCAGYPGLGAKAVKEKTASLRTRVDPRDIPLFLAARRLGLTENQFIEALPELLARGFPDPDPTTRMFDLDAIDAWRRARHPHLFLTSTVQARDASAVVLARLRGESRWAK